MICSEGLAVGAQAAVQIRGKTVHAGTAVSMDSDVDRDTYLHVVSSQGRLHTLLHLCY